jgi:integrating conjugative element protein (TIGR03756 family)
LGVCFWLKCSFAGCDIKESIRVGHYIPDLVVASYTYQTAWEDTLDWNDTPSGAIAQTEAANNQETPLDFKHVDIISHPALPVFNTMGDDDYFCQSMLDVPLFPHFLSSLDPAWSDPGVEQLLPQSLLGTLKIETSVWLPGVGHGYWAPVYPRCGWGAHPYDPINAAVAAHRASEIVTRKAQPHVYVPATGKCENRCWPPAPVKANETRANRFQMLAPSLEHSAHAFGGSATWANGKHKTRERYVWALWRYYACCEAKGAFIEKIDY